MPAAHGLVVVLLVDGLADEFVVIEDADLGDVAGVVADHDRTSDVAGQSRRDVAQALEADAIAAHDAGLGDGQQQSVEVFQALGHSGQPAIGDPRAARGGSELAVRAVVVGGQERLQGSIEVGQGQFRCRPGVPFGDVSGQGGE